MDESRDDTESQRNESLTAAVGARTDALPEELAAELREGQDAEHVLDLESSSFTDAATGTRDDMRAFWRGTVFVVGLVLSTFHLYTAIFGTYGRLQQGAFHLALGLVLIFLLYPSRTDLTRRQEVTGWVLSATGARVLVWMLTNDVAGWNVVGPAAVVLVLAQLSRHLPLRLWGMPIADLIFALAAGGAAMYVFVQREELERQAGLADGLDITVATVGVLLILVATKRVIGTPLVVLASGALLYAYHGQAMPDFFAHGGFSVDRILAHSFLGTEAVFSTPIYVSSTFIFIFLIFAALLQRTGMEQFFTKLAFGLTGWMTGGTGKVSVLTSAFAGTITGSSVANTVSNGAFTIPMMKRSGYSSEFSGGVEAASSTGGQLMPPIMGAAAFLMIEFTGIPYREIIIAAIIPSMLFFAAQFVVIHYESKRIGITGFPRSKLPKVPQLLLKQGYLLVPIGVIFYVLLAGYSAIRAAWYAVAATVLINLGVQLIALLLRRWKSMGHKLTLANLLDALVGAARVALPIIAACASAGILVGVITLTGIGLHLARGMVSLAGQTLLLTMVFAMVTCLVLGIGLPTTANYVITATMVAPALVFFDPVPVIAAHMFVFYFGIMADITPPVCLAAYAAAGIAKSEPLRTGVRAVGFAVSGFVVPYMFVLSPELLLWDATWGTAVPAIVTALIGVYALGLAVVGHIHRDVNWLVRIGLAVAGLSLLHGDVRTDLAGFALLGGIYFWQWWTGPHAEGRELRELAAATQGPGTTSDTRVDDPS